MHSLTLSLPPAIHIGMQHHVKLRLRDGRTYAGNIVTIHVEDTHFRVTCDGAEIAIHPRNGQHPVTRWKAKIHAPRI